MIKLYDEKLFLGCVRLLHAMWWMASYEWQTVEKGLVVYGLVIPLIFSDIILEMVQWKNKQSKK